jgi:hypothetical protein
MKREFFAVDDYGTGGIWLLVWARSEEEITNKFSELKVRDARPEWMTDEVYLRLNELRCYDIDDEPSGYLKDLIDGRTQPR